MKLLCTCTVVFMPGATTSAACGANAKSARKAVVVFPSAKPRLAAIVLHSSRLLGMPLSCDSGGATEISNRRCAKTILLKKYFKLWSWGRCAAMRGRIYAAGKHISRCWQQHFILCYENSI